MTSATTRFIPDYAIPPGATLAEVLEDQQMSQAELAKRTGLSTKHISQIINGHASISVDVALRLERATGMPTRLWNNLETRYQEHSARIAEVAKLTNEIDVLDLLPIGDMVRRGLLTKRAKSVDRLREVYEFFGVADRGALQSTWGATLASFRKSQAHESDSWAVAVWLRLGEIQANEIDTQPFNIDVFRASLKSTRALTTSRDPRSWHPKLVELCARAGVAVVVVDEVSGARTNGATRWLGPDRALIQLSLRYRWSDIFWFTFFHEAKHIIDHAKRSIVLEYAGKARTGPEAAADRFAADFLIPPTHADRLARICTQEDATRFAESLGVHPGIVVGRLHHEGLWPYKRGHRLRQRLQLVDD